MKPTAKLAAMAAAAGLACFAAQAGAAWSFAPADTVLAFQATAGQGATTNLFFNLGNSVLLSGADGVLGNINNDLTATFGANWYSRSDLWFGVVANRSNLAPGFPNFDTGGPGEDPGRTWYTSVATAAAGAGLSWSGINSSALGTAGTNYNGLKTVLANLDETAFGAGVAVLDQTTQPVEWNNSWSKWNPTPGAAFGTFTGGVQNNFGKAAPYVMLDIQRVQASQTGTYVNTLYVTGDGTLVIPEPSSVLLAGLAGLGALMRRRRA
jgi:hypothetical protein